MESQISRWGNSLGVRIPKAIAQGLGLVEGTPVEIEVDDEKITIRKKRYSLRLLVGGITPENRHSEATTGMRIGREVW